MWLTVFQIGKFLMIKFSFMVKWGKMSKKDLTSPLKTPVLLFAVLFILLYGIIL